MPKDLVKIQENVKLLLTKYPKFRTLKMRKPAIWGYWREFEGLKYVMTEPQFFRFTKQSTIERAIRKVQEQNPKLRPSIEEQIKRYEASNEFADHFGKKNGEMTDEEAEQFSKQCL